MHSAICLFPLSVYQVSFHSLLYFQRYAPDNLFIVKIRNGDNSVINCDRFMVLAFCTFSDDPLLMYQVSFNSLVFFQRYFADKLSSAKINNKSNSVNTVGMVTSLALCTFADGPLSMYQVLFRSFIYFQRYAPDKPLIAKMKKKSNSVNTVDSVFCCIVQFSS